MSEIYFTYLVIYLLPKFSCSTPPRSFALFLLNAVPLIFFKVLIHFLLLQLLYNCIYILFDTSFLDSRMFQLDWDKSNTKEERREKVTLKNSNIDVNIARLCYAIGMR